MNRIYTLLLFSFFTLPAPLYADLSENGDKIQLRHIEIKKYNGQNDGALKYYPGYETLNQFETLIGRLPNRQNCARVLFYIAGKHLPEIDVLHERLSNSGECKKVLSF